MFSYLHGYMPEVWDAYEKRGLIREADGIRICHSMLVPEDLKFNRIAACGGRLHKIISERKCPLYIDRLQGGSIIFNYDYDRELLDEYEKMLGDKFLGFQMHEWLSNYRNEIMSKTKDVPSDNWTAEAIEDAIRKKYPINYLFLEAMTLEELVAAGKPSNPREMYDNMTAIYIDRVRRYKKLVPCDSYFLMYPFEAANGATLIMPEIGAQTPDTRIQMSFARGVTRANGIKFGAYYEPWGGNPFTACNFQADERNEWFLSNESGDFPFYTAGANGGSSRSLQWRMHLYAYLSNVDYISEKWGIYNTFNDHEDFELSEYGLVKKRFIDFVDRYPDVGEKLTPVAAVISNDLLCYTLSDPSFANEDHDNLFGYPIAKDESDKMKKLKTGVNKIFSNPSPMIGDEIHNLINSDIPDAVDMLNEGDGTALGKYDYLVDLTNDPEFAQKHKNCISPDEVAWVLHKLLPCKVDGGLHYMVNRRGKGGFYLTVFNHSGIERSVAKGEIKLAEATKTVKITFNHGFADRRLDVLEGDGRLECLGGVYYATVPAGGFMFMAF